MKVLKKINQIYKKTNVFVKLLFGLSVLYIFILITSKYNEKKEGFVQREKFLMKTGKDVYDNFYSDIYDELVYDSVKNNYEVGELERITKMEPNKSIILDIGSGTGHHMNIWKKKGYNIKGIDTSKAMIEKAKTRYSDLDIKQGNVSDAMNFQQNIFTHINCLYFTIYYIKNKKTFFENCFQWLKPGGYLSLHLVNRNMFSPILNSADPLQLVSPQKYTKKRITNSIVKFKDFQYKADFKLNPEKNKANFEEVFKDDKTGHIRKNEHNFYMPTQKNILSVAKECGFNLLGKIDMVNIQYEYQYIYILYKPN